MQFARGWEDTHSSVSMRVPCSRPFVKSVIQLFSSNNQAGPYALQESIILLEEKLTCGIADSHLQGNIEIAGSLVEDTC